MSEEERLATQFTLFLDRPGISAFTRDKYFYRLRAFIGDNGHLQPGDVTTAMLSDYINAQSHLADASKAIICQCFHALFAFCGVSPNPADGLPNYRETPKHIRLPDEDAVKLALETAVRLNEGDDPVNIRDGLIFALAVVSGNRRGEIHNLPHQDLLAALNAPGDVYHAYTTGKTGEAVLRFTQFHVPMIGRYLAIRPETSDAAAFVCLNANHSNYGKQLSLVAIDRVRPKICRLAGISIITYQELRRRLATLVARSEGVDVAALVLNHSPHSGDRVIRAYYYDPDKARADRAALSIFSQITE